MNDRQDAFGQALFHCLKGMTGHTIIERDDGYIEAENIRGYFGCYKDWAPQQKRAIRHVRGRVLDVGCGAGRHAIHLQGSGHKVLGIDASPLAIRVSKKRGLRRVKVMSITGVTPALGTFDTIVMLGNNFGLFGSYSRARRLLRVFNRITSDDGRIVAETLDPHLTDNPFHKRYQEENRRRGRMSGQIRLRVRFQKYATPWYDYLFVSKEEMEKILEGTSWRVTRFIDSGGPVYVAIIDKLS